MKKGIKCLLAALGIGGVAAGAGYAYKHYTKIHGIGSICAPSDEEEDLSDETLVNEMISGLIDIIENPKDLYDNVPASTFGAIYEDREILYNLIGLCRFVDYDKTSDTVTVVDVEDYAYNIYSLTDAEGVLHTNFYTCRRILHGEDKESKD